MLSLRNLSFRTGHRELLQDVSLDVLPGQILMIIGANGAGKSTLLKIAGGALPPARGEVRIGGRKLGAWRQRELAQFCAVLHQQTPLSLPFPVKDVVMMGRYPHYSGEPSALDRTIAGNAMRKAGIEALAERNYLDLSGGEQQRVHLARVFAQVWYARNYDTRYLFLDEPSNNLDIRHQHLMLSMSREFAAEGNCVVMVMHDLNLAMQYADTILLLKGGRVVASGPVEEVMNERHISEAYDFPTRIIRHSAYDFPIVMPVAASAANGAAFGTFAPASSPERR